MDTKPLILITNDDGIFSKGIRSLVEVAKQIGDVIVVAPDSPQSGMGHAITINNLLRLNKSGIFEEIEAYTCSGTPVDCVKLGIYEVLKRKPDILLSGINHGENTSTNVLYSGTMSAAVEGAMEHIPAIGFSLADYSAEADFTLAKEVVKSVLESVLNNAIPKGICLNVNIPKVEKSRYKGIQVCKAASAFWEDKFDKRLDQFGKEYYWMTGNFSDEDNTPETDLYYIKKGFTTIVPIQFDMTAYTAIDNLKNWKFD